MLGPHGRVGRADSATVQSSPLLGTVDSKAKARWGFLRASGFGRGRFETEGSFSGALGSSLSPVARQKEGHHWAPPDVLSAGLEGSCTWPQRILTAPRRGTRRDRCVEDRGLV